MNRSNVLTLATFATAFAMTHPMAAADSEALPAADEQCVAQCDTRTDRCMAEAGGDENKQQACDDAYTECLKLCR